MMVTDDDRVLIEETRRRAIPLGPEDGVDALVRDLADSRVVLLGESTHGTEEFYEWRRRISSRLISEHGFRIVAVEGDWPACWKINRYVTGHSRENARGAFSSFRRWPNWMWANASVLKFVEWLRARNARFENARDRAGFFGLDVFSLFESVDVVVRSLDRTDPALAERARDLYGCLKGYGKSEREYARSLVESPEGCREQLAEALEDTLRLRLEAEAERGPKSRRSADDAEELAELFNIEQNARVARDAELYYRAIVEGGEDAWNVRDRHMLDTLERVLAFHGPSSKAIVWAHNQHVGDYRGSPLREGKQVSLGGLARDRWGAKAVSLVGFGTYRGEVTAARAWGESPEKLVLPPARPGSYESIFHAVATELREDAFYLPFRGTAARESVLGRERRPQRTVGVVYYPEYEHFGNYVDTAIAKRFDAFVHIDRTRAVSVFEGETRATNARERPPEDYSPEL